MIILLTWSLFVLLMGLLSFSANRNIRTAAMGFRLFRVGAVGLLGGAGFGILGLGRSDLLDPVCLLLWYL